MAYPEWEMYDEKEEDRLEHVQIMKAKGKGPPKKNKTKVGMYICSAARVWFDGYDLLTVLHLQRSRRKVGRRGSFSGLENCVRCYEAVEVIIQRCISEFEAFAGVLKIQRYRICVLDGTQCTVPIGPSGRWRVISPSSDVRSVIKSTIRPSHDASGEPRLASDTADNLGTYINRCCQSKGAVHAPSR